MIMHNEIEKIRSSFEEILFSKLDNSFNNGAELNAFILILLGIDCLSGSYSNEESSIKTFKKFISDFPS